MMNLLYFKKKRCEKMIEKLSRKNIFTHNFWKLIHRQNIKENF